MLAGEIRRFEAVAKSWRSTMLCDVAMIPTGTNRGAEIGDTRIGDEGVLGWVECCADPKFENGGQKVINTVGVFICR